MPLQNGPQKPGLFVGLNVGLVGATKPQSAGFRPLSLDAVDPYGKGHSWPLELANQWLSRAIRFIVIGCLYYRFVPAPASRRFDCRRRQQLDL
jgi:hypothetical protein